LWETRAHYGWPEIPLSVTDGAVLSPTVPLSVTDGAALSPMVPLSAIDVPSVSPMVPLFHRWCRSFIVIPAKAGIQAFCIMVVAPGSSPPRG